MTSVAFPTPLPTPTATQVPSRNLVICLEQEPASLYLYGSSTRSTASVLESIYDGPFDVLDYEPQPVIFEKMPSYADGDAIFQPVSVNEGDQVVDINGDLVSLTAGVQVLPAGCTGMDCAITWNGTDALQMDQEVVTFTLRADIAWSDGAALTAEDSVYSFRVAADENTPVSHQLVYRTENYTALDAVHVQWIGVPGFFPERLDTIFWSPLPEHVWGNITPADLLTNEISSQYPIGWGPYIIEEWVSGDHIQLKKNPLYFRASEGLPAFDNLVYRFLGEGGDSLVAALESKECDLIDQSSSLESQLTEIRDLEKQGALKTHINVGPEWEQLVFGIDNSTYDDGYSPFSGDRPDFFSDSRTRQAFAYCIDRQKIVDELLQGLSYTPSTYLPDTHPLHEQDAQLYPYNPEAGRQLLDQVGWKDWDGNPETPLQSVGISNIQDGTFFSINYYTTQAALRQEMADVIKDSLAGCGIEVNVNLYTPDEMYAEGPEGPLFGRNFDLAQFAWSSGVLPLCEFYVSSQIPAAENNWLTLNIGGYQNPDYD
ncbi:MAG: ABC transporter substrate-binding protein, partial [Chloroflexi bacterium]|nr:ABC transporter substrate-binding protein [Chloroflexota bacterium]